MWDKIETKKKKGGGAHDEEINMQGVRTRERREEGKKL